MRCIIIGASPALSEMMGDVVETYGHAVVCAVSCGDGLTQLRISPFDLALLGPEITADQRVRILQYGKALRPELQHFQLSGTELHPDGQEVQVPDALHRLLDSLPAFAGWTQTRLDPQLAWLQ